jgi:hypothetical protein
MVRRRRAARATLLREKPRNIKCAAVMAELALIHNSPRLTGRIKHILFARGAHQLEALGQ